MTEQRNGEQTPPAFAFIKEATPGTSRESGEDASGPSDDYPAYIDEYINDALKALNRQTDATDVNDATDSGSANYAPVVSTASADHAWPRTSHADIEKLSSPTKDTASCSDDAWRCQRNAQHRPIADQTYNLDGVYSSRSLSHVHLGPTSSIDHKKPSTSRAGMVEASASLQYGARNPHTTRVHQSNTQYYSTAGASTMQGYTHNRETGSTSFTLPVYSSSVGGKYAVASTSHAGTEEASGILGNDARIPDASGAEPWSMQYYAACGTTTVSGHTHVTESGITSSLPMASSSSVNHGQPSTSRARMEEASAVTENIARNAPGTVGREQRELCGVLHGHAKEPTDDTTQICRACDQSSVKMSKSVEHFRNRTGKKRKCETCGKEFHRAYDLTHHRTHTDERPYKCQVCEKSFRHSCHLKIHNRTHTDERPHKCQICAKSFRQSSHLDNHRRTHTDERPYKCQICNKSFRQSNHLDNHKRVHTGEKPYICKTCSKSYTQLATLRTHEHTHAEEKPHACQKCGKSFEKKYDLKRHLDCQCGNSAFVCEICDRFFMKNSTLLRHRRTKHVDETPFECMQCGCRFADKETRDRHLCQEERKM
nr:zinc finger protein ZFP2-like [Dermacentor andersoni]